MQTGLLFHLPRHNIFTRNVRSYFLSCDFEFTLICYFEITLLHTFLLFSVVYVC